MWKTVQVWFLLKKSLHHHHFQYLSPLQPSQRQRQKPKLWQIIIFWMLSVLFIATGQLQSLLGTLRNTSLTIFTIPILIIVFTSGFHLAGKIVNRIGIIERSGMYDLISITPNGDNAKWFMTRLVYQNTKWLTIFELFLVIGTLGIIAIGFINGENLLSLIILYVWFTQQLIIGYLVGLLCCQLNIGIASRMMIGISLSIGIQLGLAIITISFLGVYLYFLFFRMEWDINILGLVQLFGFLGLLEITVRVLLLFITSLSETPYSVRRSEVGI